MTSTDTVNGAREPRAPPGPTAPPYAPPSPAIPSASSGRSGGLAAALFTAGARRDPYPLYARMRRDDPVHRSPEGIWYLTRHADVEAALGDLRLSNDRDRMTRAYSSLGGDLKALEAGSPSDWAG